MAEPGGAEIPVDLGWRMDSDEAALAFFPPEPLDAGQAEALASLDPLGSAEGLARRVLQIRCPYNLRVRVTPRGVKPVTFFRVDEPGSLSEGAFQGLFQFLEPSAQRRADLPVVQVSLNVVMVTEEPCALMLTPPFLAEGYRDWPGPIVSGRFPIRSWPRVLNAVMEWEDRDRDWVLRRGEPMAYLWVGFDDPRKVPRLVEAATTPALETHYRRVSGVIEYGRNVAPMFAEAERRRPPRLLVPKRTGTPAWD